MTGEGTFQAEEKTAANALRNGEPERSSSQMRKGKCVTTHPRSPNYTDPLDNEWLREEGLQGSGWRSDSV